MYVIFSFYEEGSVEAVPYSWCVNESSCYWPPAAQQNDVIKLIQEAVAPEKDWKLYEGKILFKTALYSKARDQLNKAEITSDIASEAELGRGKRPRVLKRRTTQEPVDESDSKSEEENDDEKLSKKKKAGRKQIILPKAPEFPHDNDIDLAQKSDLVISPETSSEIIQEVPKISSVSKGFKMGLEDTAAKKLKDKALLTKAWKTLSHSSSQVEKPKSSALMKKQVLPKKIKPSSKVVKNKTEKSIVNLKRTIFSQTKKSSAISNDNLNNDVTNESSIDSPFVTNTTIDSDASSYSEYDRNGKQCNKPNKSSFKKSSQMEKSDSYTCLENRSALNSSPSNGRGPMGSPIQQSDPDGYACNSFSQSSVVKPQNYCAYETPTRSQKNRQSPPTYSNNYENSFTQYNEGTPRNYLNSFSHNQAKRSENERRNKDHLSLSNTEWNQQPNNSRTNGLDAYFRSMETFRKTSIMMLADLNTKVDKVLANNLQDRSNRMENENLEIPGFPPLPIQTLEDLQTVEELLQNEAIKIKTVKKFASFGGKNIPDCTRRILKNVLGHKLVLEFNWIGVNGKYAFKELVLKNTITGAVQTNIKGTKEFDVEKIIKNWVKYAPDREGGRNQRNNKGKNQENSSECESD